MKQENPKTFAVPKLRFPEFREVSGWTSRELGELATPIKDRVGTTECIPYTVTSGVGLVSQDEKFGRSIAGNSIKNYIVLRKNAFAYNKSATKTFPEGFIARYVGDDRAAVPNSIFTCFAVDETLVDPAYLDYLFHNNLHGKWLRDYITVGARAHGSLNVNGDDLMVLPVPLPDGSASLSEQRKIADCLGSLDELIAAHGRKLEALRACKKGLMQQLFLRQGETRPRLRFPEFRDTGEWEERLLKEVAEINPNREKMADETLVSFIPMSSVSEDGGLIEYPTRPFSEVKKGYTFFRERDIIFAKITPCFENGKAALLGHLKNGVGLGSTEFHVVRARHPHLPEFLFAHLYSDTFRRMGVAAMTGSAGQQRVPAEFFGDYRIGMPAIAEQQRIAACMSSLDALIAAQTEKLDALKTHKKGLMQQLFPSPT